MRRSVTAIAIVLLLAVSSTYSATLLVPTDYGTIQAALDAAADGDEVVVEPGTYFESVVIPPISVTLRSQSDDPANTILDGTGNAASPAMVFFEGDSAGTRTIQGFTLTNSEARAVDIEDIFLRADHQIVKNCRFINNGPGTPLHAGQGSMDILDNEFIDNGGTVAGGAILMRGAASIRGNLFRNNAAIPVMDINNYLSNAGAIFLSNSFPAGAFIEILDNTFEDSYCNDYGGAVFISQNINVVVSGNTFLRNVADICAGAIYVVQNKHSVIIEKNLFVENSSLAGSAIGIDCCAAGTIVRKNTIVNTLGGAGIQITESNDIVIRGNVVAFGESWGIRWFASIHSQFSGTQTCNDAFGNPSGNFVGNVTSRKNFSLDPLFCDLTGGDFFLKEGSPCLAPNNSCNLDIGAFSLGCGEVAVFIQRFDARIIRTAIHLEWELFADEPLTGFNIYRRDGRDGYETILNKGGLIPEADRSFDDTDFEAGRNYYYALTLVMPDGSEVKSPLVEVRTMAYTFLLGNNYPNPFNPETTIRFTLDREAHVTLSIYDAQGRWMKTLIDDVQGDGQHETRWDGTDAAGASVSSGVYFYRLKAGAVSQSRRMVLLK
ncbi:MAG: right-handed parallel beta-helix repeat-containing protein [bacterium]|nr:right-handed parallel beta-helix repeat-containing protein [bacterium]